MSLEQVTSEVYRIDFGMVNAYLLDHGDGLTLIDTGTPGNAEAILESIHSLGRTKDDLAQILVTHLHADHSGSLARLKELTGAPSYMHPVDAAMVRQGQASRPSEPAPGLMNWLIVNVMMAVRGSMEIEPAEIDHEIRGGDELEVAGGLRVIHAPGHAAGQVCFLWERHGGILFAADAASNMMGLGFPPIFEDQTQGIKSLRQLSEESFEIACFGHGSPLKEAASRKFTKKWGGNH